MQAIQPQSTEAVNNQTGEGILNPEQLVLVRDLSEFCSLPFADLKSPFFVVEGRAGTGKTFCVQWVLKRLRGRALFTAPTNKATKVLRESLTSDDYKPECRTIYSALALRMGANGEVKELMEPDEPVDLSDYKVIFVDEASMVNSTLLRYIKKAVDDYGVRIVLLGDRAQLNPVGEVISPVWKLNAVQGHLTRIMRFDNQILTLSNSLYEKVSHPFPSFQPPNDNKGDEGVWNLSATDFRLKLDEHVVAGSFLKPNGTKLIAWRNATVDNFNQIIRNRLYGPEIAKTLWLPEDRAIITAPVYDLDDKPIASTDDEGVVTSCREDWHPVYPEFKIWRLVLTLDQNKVVTLFSLHPDSAADFKYRTEQMVAAAKFEGRKWREHWQFQEAFHKVRHAYAITAHRSQGSTYETAFVQWRDILINRDRTEAMRCLYVACSRAKKQLYLGG